jgi:hypothetical protein
VEKINGSYTEQGNEETKRRTTCTKKNDTEQGNEETKRRTTCTKKNDTEQKQQQNKQTNVENQCIL